MCPECSSRPRSKQRRKLGAVRNMWTSCPRCQHTFRTPCCQFAQCRVNGIALSGGGLITESVLVAGPAANVVDRVSLNGGDLYIPSWPTREVPPPVRLSFVLPSPQINPNPFSFFQLQSETEAKRILATKKSLDASGWYYEQLTWLESTALLASTAPGTFLVRGSSDPRYLFSLSVQTEKGPTSVRIHFSNGLFRLDSQPSLVPAMPLFDCVVKLIQFYVCLTKDVKLKNPTGKEHVWIDHEGRVYYIHLKRPLYQKSMFPSLQHLARLAFNSVRKNGELVPKLQLPVILKDYLLEYPYLY